MSEDTARVDARAAKLMTTSLIVSLLERGLLEPEELRRIVEDVAHSEVHNPDDPAFHSAVAREVEVIAMASYAVDTPSRWGDLLDPYDRSANRGLG
jgi:hypothetical protein